MGNQETPAIGGLVDRVPHDEDVSEAVADEVPRRFIMIAGHVDDLHALAGQPQDLLHHIIVGLGPIPAVPELPTVDDVAHQVEGVEFGGLYEIEQEFGLAPLCAEVDVRNEDRPVSVFIVHHHRSPPADDPLSGRQLV